MRVAIIASLVVATATVPASAAPMSKPPAFAICGVCHKVENGAPHGIGPNLFGVGGKRAGAAPGYAYSPAMTKSGITWTKPKLAAFISAPQKVVPGTKMTFVGIKDRKQADAVAAYLMSLK
jgi:cytochrome c